MARIHMTYEEEIENAKKIIKRSRDLTQMMMDEKFIPDAPDDDGEHKVDIETIKSAY